ncbi:MAG: insulinase family protein [Bacteroidetes bacterium]|nr:insulinase family protein [Bacteroidota bacterium]
MSNLNRNIQPDINLVDRISLVKPVFERMDNGIPVYLIDTAQQDLIKIEFMFSGGSWYETKKLIANFTNRMLKEGTPSMSSRDIADRIDYYGAHLETSSDKDMGYVSLYSLNKHLDKTLPVLAEIIQSPVFNQKELDTLKQNRKQHFLVNNEKVRYLAKRKFNELIFGKGHPYGKVFSSEDFDQISRNDLVSFHNQFYTAGNCKVIAAGKIPGNLLSLLNKYFGNFSGNVSQQPILPAIDMINPEDKKAHLVKKNAVQTAIRVGKVLFNKTHPDYVRLKVLNTILGGYFGSRLMSNIREDKGYTYGIGSAIVSLHHSGYFFITSEVGSDVAQDAIREIYHEIDHLRQEKVPQQELDLVKNYILGSFLRSNDGAFAQADNFKSLLEYGLDYTYFDHYIEIVKAINTGEILDLAQQYLDPESLRLLTVGQE